MIILIDNGHGKDTAGKCSPDGSLREWSYTREIAQRLCDELNAKGVHAIRIVTESEDISLTERVRRVNTICQQFGTKNVLLVSIHVNAAESDGAWHWCSGWSVYVSPNSSKNSKRLAATLYEEAAKRNLQGNRYVPGCRYWMGSFAIIRDTWCPAVLTENLFQDNKAEVRFLLSEEGKSAIVSLHVEGILNYLK